MRRLDIQETTGPSLDVVPWKSLYRKETYDAPTADGWILQVTRYKPVKQSFEQPIFGEPLLLVPGWSQNRHAFSCGSFVKNLLYFGADVHILELRGHGKSSRALQLERHQNAGGVLPADFDFDWDLDSYFQHDVPAGVRAVKERTGRDKIFYVGNSMGGMLGYGYAGCHDDLLGLVTIGAPSDIGRGFLPLRLAAMFGPTLVAPLLDTLLAAVRGADSIRHGAAKVLRKLRLFDFVADRIAAAHSTPRDVRFTHVPMDLLLRELSKAVTEKNLKRYEKLAQHVTLMINPSRVTADEFQWLLREGGEKEPRKVVEQFARWIRDDEMTCYRTGYDYKAGFANIDVPLAVIWGGLDKIASAESTQSIYRNARSEYLLWRPVKNNNHLELTMGYDIRHICEDIRDLVEYAVRRERAQQRRPRAAYE
jgi:pimeloyl-ACP methyl ester carboxylesterase